MSSDRHFVCGGCHGVVSVPHGRRKITLDQVRETHHHSCPSRGVTRREVV